MPLGLLNQIDQTKTVVIRGALVDSIKMRALWSRRLIASGIMGAGYAVAKAVAFTLLALALGLKTGGYAAWYGVWIAASVVSWVVLAVCIVRGPLVIIEVQGLFESAEFQVAAPSVSHE